MPLLTITLLTFSFLCFIAIIAIVIYIKKQKSQMIYLETQLNTIELTVNELEFAFRQQNLLIEKILLSTETDKTENDQISQSLERRIKHLQNEQTQINEKLTSFKEQEPEDKFYNRALKLARLGADIEEIINNSNSKYRITESHAINACSELI